MSKLYIVGTPIGNLGDMTKRGLEVLESVDLVLCEDTRHSLKLFNHFEIKNKLQSYHKFNEKEKSGYIVDKILEEDIDVALISDAGMPCVSDPGYELVKCAREAGIEVLGVPGASAAVTALAVSGLNSDNFAFYGFLDRENAKIIKKLEEIKKSNIKTSIIYESPKRLIKLVEKINEVFEAATICICSDLTKLHERAIYGEVEEVLERIKSDDKIEKGEYVVVLENKEEAKEESLFANISIEALIFDKILKEDCTLKDAVKLVSKEHNIPKNEVYEASLRVKTKMSI